MKDLYITKLEYLLQEILEHFEDDPSVGWVFYNEDEEPYYVGDELDILLNKTNDLLYGADDFDEEYLSEHSGYPTEEEGE
jgi:hypothetical protein